MSFQTVNLFFNNVLANVLWVKKCMEYEVEGPRPRGRPKRTWTEVVREDCQARKMNKEDAIDHCKWRKMIKDVRWSGWVWVGECFFWYRLTQVVPDKRSLNGCVCVGVYVCVCDALKTVFPTYTHTCLMAFFPGPHGWASTRKVEPIWILLKQKTVSGNGISWAIRKSAPCSIQTTTPAPHRSVFHRPDALPAAQPTASKHGTF